MQDRPLRALYYPYSRCQSEVTLKRALLAYDQIVFVDPVHRDIVQWSSGTMIIPQDELHILRRDSHRFTWPEWESMRDTYAYLQERGAVRIYDPRPIVTGNADILLGSYSASIKSRPLLEYYSGINDPDQMLWIMHESRLPSGAEGSPSITAQPRRIYRPEELYRSSKLNQIEPLPAGFVALHVNDAFPLILDQALLICEAESFVPLTDDPAAYAYLGERCRFMAKSYNISAATKVDITDLFRFGQVTLAAIARTIPDEALANRSFAEIIKYRSEASEPLSRFRSWLRRLTFGLEEAPLTDDAERELHKLLETVIVPEVEKLDEQMRKLWATMFTDIGGKLGEAALKATAATAPSLTIAAAAGLSPGLMVAMAAASFFSSIGISLPSLSAYINGKRDLKHSFAYFLWKIRDDDREGHARNLRALYSLTKTQEAILTVLANSRKSLARDELNSVTHISPSSIEVALIILVKRGLVYKSLQGEKAVYFTAVNPVDLK